MGYDRNKAIDYAKRFWDRPCDDDIFWLTNERISIPQKRRELHAPASEGWVARFVPDGKGREKAVFERTVGKTREEKVIAEWEGLADCAHFLSKCLQAGGAKVDERGVSLLVNTLQGRSDTKTLAEKISKDQGQKVIDLGIFKQGDMLGYFNVDPAGDYGRLNSYTHSTMFSGKLDPKDVGRVTCHTMSRFGGLSHVADQWYLHSGYTYTLIHFSSDDVAPTAAMQTKIDGWWAVTAGSMTVYYYVSKSGRAFVGKRAPKSNRERLGPSAPGGSGYWFQDKDKLTFIWRKSGAFEVWTDDPGKNAFKVRANGTVDAIATKLF